jgi:hypothetical protein
VTFATDIAGDLTAVADGLEAVTLRPPDDDHETADVSITQALRRAIGRKEVEASGGKYTARDVVWHFKVSAGTPIVGGVIVDADSVEWSILETAKQTLGSRWRCVTTKLAVDSPGYDALVEVQEATWTKGTSGAQKVSAWLTVVAGVAARIEEKVSQVEIEGGAKTTKRTYRIALDLAQTLSQSHRLRDADGDCYRIESVEPATLRNKQVVLASKDLYSELA